MKKLASLGLVFGLLCALEGTEIEAKKATSSSAYGDKWLVILSSSKKAGAQPPSLKTLKTNGLDGKVTRLSSSEYKNLSPCYEIVIADAFADKSKATEFSKKLKTLKVDHYLKNAGTYVGKQPEIDTLCGVESLDNTTAISGLHWTRSFGDNAYLHLEEVSEATQKKLSKPKNQKALDTTGYSVWQEPIADKALDGYSIGQSFQTYNTAAEAAGSCTITSFAWMTWGVPHFGVLQEAQENGTPLKAPRCGEPELYAVLSCKESAGELAFASGHKAPTLLKSVPLDDDVKYAATKKLLLTDLYDQKKLEGEEFSESAGVSLEEEMMLWEYSFGGKTFLQLDVFLKTGEGSSLCGQDFASRLVGSVEVVNGKVSRVALPLEETSEASSPTLLDIDSDGKLEYLEQHYLDDIWIRVPGQKQPREDNPGSYCDCAC